MRNSNPGHPLRSVAAAAMALLVAGCAAYQPAVLEQQEFLQRAVTQSSGGVTVSMAVPDAAETRTLTGLDLYAQGIQPLWLQVENNSNDPLRASLWSLDRDYFSAIEVAYMNRRKFSGEGYSDMERWFHQNQLRRQVPVGETVRGLVYTNHEPGTRGFNFDLMGTRSAHTFTMFVPVPGFRPDYANVDFHSLYHDSEWRDLDQAQLLDVLENELPCCAHTDRDDTLSAPFNVVLVGTANTVRRALLRGHWRETSADRSEAGTSSRQRFSGRSPDTVFTRPRHDGNEKLVLNLWLAPWRTSDEPVWIGQAYYWSDSLAEMAAQAGQRVFRDTELFEWFAKESIAADVDAAARFLTQNFWYNQSVSAVGTTASVRPVPLQSPAIGHGGSAYFTDGYRLVLYLSDEPVGLDETRILFHRQPMEKPPEDKP